jgi:hypothetical protein
VIIQFPLNGITWYVVSVRFASAYLAKETWETVERKSKGRSQDVGLYRHGPSTDPGRYLTAVTTEEADARWINNLLRGCLPHREPDEVIEAMIMRRLDVIAGARLAGRTEGRIAIRRPEAGAKLDPDGTMHEPVLGEG